MRSRDVPHSLHGHDFPRIALRLQFIEKRRYPLVVDEHHFRHCRRLLHLNGAKLNPTPVRFRSWIAPNDRLEFLETQIRADLRCGKLISVAECDHVHRINVAGARAFP